MSRIFAKSQRPQTALLPADYRNFILRHILQSNTPVQIAKRKFVYHARRTFDVMYPFVQPLVSRFLGALYDSPDVVVIIFTLTVLYLAFQVLNWMRRVVMFWTRMVVRATILAFIVSLLSMAYQRGLEQSMRDVFVVGGKLSGYVAWAKDIWLREYGNYQAAAANGEAQRGAYANARSHR